MKKKILWTVVAILAVAAAATYALTRPEPADTRFTGAYSLDDGSFVFVTPREGKVLRYRTMEGESAALWPVADNQYEGGKGWGEREPVINRFRFEMDDAGHPTGLSWEKFGEESGEQPGEGSATPPRHAVAMKLPEQIFTFSSGNLTLRGKLVLPAGTGPFPAVVLVHGSEADSAVDHYFEPYLYAANGFASLVFDKRGTGESEGEYVQNFRVLAGDVLAAVQWLRKQQAIDGARIHFAGFSQGGWIAPLAALQDGGIRSLIIGYGPMVPVTGEDRWGYVYALRQKGFGDDAIAGADRINAVIEDILDRGENRWSELGEMLDAARPEPWFATVRGSDSALGLVAGMKMPLWMVRVYAWWKIDRHRDNPFIDRSYDPVPTLAALNAPSLWIFGGEDSSMPTEWTIDELRKLQAGGKPIEYVVYPDADHGILRFEQAADGGRRLVGYEPDYFKRQVEWLKQHSR